ncbi:aspartate dehydrogenase domain-containing protein [Nioella aestuarii]|uniref:aspartate dehydrogenase domain-containing protein n=1 Tax=Nioella aestuarii TaxID=1662864 RepID=UPI003D7F805E
MPSDPITVSLIGKGRIGAQVARGLNDLPGYQLVAVVGRHDDDLPSARLTIDAAGPQALRRHGAAALSTGDLWTVGAAALIDPVLREQLQATALRKRHKLCLFTDWISGPTLCPPSLTSRLFIRQFSPTLSDNPGVLFRGPLSEAAARFPDQLNTATAAAICGPGIDATHVTLTATPKGGAHRIAARFVMPGQTIRTEVRFDGTGPHPVASAILAALARRAEPVSIGGW